MRRLARPLAGALLALALAGAPGVAEAAPWQDAPTITVERPHIVPQPNSGAEPEEAGDRGGSLQLGIFVLVCATLAGGVAHLVRQSQRLRRAQADAQPDASTTSASQAGSPSTNPDR